eukprot:scaffold64618_cov54-Phaeocystis_antarctica.AAC.6
MAKSFMAVRVTGGVTLLAMAGWGPSATPVATAAVTTEIVTGRTAKAGGGAGGCRDEGENPATDYMGCVARWRACHVVLVVLCLSCCAW